MSSTKFLFSNLQSRAIKPQSGFIALMSVIILGFVLLVVVITLGSRSIGTRFFLLDLERKDQSKALAEGCVQVAIIATVTNPAYSVSNTNWRIVDVDPDPNSRVICAIYSVDPNTPSSGFSRIRTTASSTGATTNLEVVWDIANERVASWREKPTLP